MGRDRGRRIRSTEGWWVAETPTAARISGKVEWDEFSTGATELSLYVRKVPVQDNIAVEVVRDDDVVLSCRVRRGKARCSVNSQGGAHVSTLRVGDTVFLRAGGQVLARATMEPD